MGQLILYAIVVLAATMAGSSVGLGGGVVIKPVLDIFSNATTGTINFYSSLAVFTMAVVSVTKQLKQHFSFDAKKLLSISLGSVIGGFLGQSLLQWTIQDLPSSIVRVIQSVFLFLTLLTVFLYTINKKKIKSYHVTNIFAILCVGIFLGTLSVFLGIGGGPINVAAMMILFSFDMRSSAVYSVGIIFFSQLTKLIMVCIPGHHVAFEWPIAICVMIFAVIGGYIGTVLNRKVDCKYLTLTYNILIGILILVTLGNTIRYIIAV